MTITRTLSARVNAQGQSEILLRISLSMNIKFRIKSGVFIKPERFRGGRIVPPRSNQKEIAQLRKTESELQEVEGAICDVCSQMRPDRVTKEMISDAVDRLRHPELHEEMRQRSFFDTWEAFLEAKNFEGNLTNCYRSLSRALHRYEAHRRATREPEYTLSIEGMTADDIAAFEHFYRNEWKYYDEYPQIYVDYPADLRTQRKTHKPSRRGDNMTAGTIKRLRAFFNWCNRQGLTDNQPFAGYENGKGERYGTPFYLTIEERDRIADFDLADKPALAVQRDIFIFQCLVGTRVSDLKRLEASSVIDGWLEYVPKKTKKERAVTVRVPLCERAQKIAERFAAEGSARLLPCISDQRYNDAIKAICRICGIDRLVTVIDSVTGQEKRRHIYEIASSHMARRTFVGNIYKQVKDPNLVGALSGHKEGSKAFARYRDIDDDIKRGLIDLIK